MMKKWRERKLRRLAKKENRIKRYIEFLSACGVHGDPDYLMERLRHTRYKMRKIK